MWPCDKLTFELPVFAPESEPTETPGALSDSAFRPEETPGALSDKAFRADAAVIADDDVVTERVPEFVRDPSVVVPAIICDVKLGKPKVVEPLPAP